jgi:hypothetical protein
VLVDDVVTPLQVGPLTNYAGNLLTLDGQRILRIGADGKAAATWQLPPIYRTYDWSKITSDGTYVYVGGTPPDYIGFHVLKLTLD